MLCCTKGLWTPVEDAGEDRGESPLDQLARAKQVKSLRLLVQLLPDGNRALLQRLLGFLARVTKHVGETRMTPIALGTIFGPLFVPAVVNNSPIEKVCLWIDLFDPHPYKFD